MASDGAVLETLVGEMIVPIDSRSFVKTVGANWSMQRS